MKKDPTYDLLVPRSAMPIHKDSVIVNGRIENTYLGTEDHGIFTFMIGIDHEDGHQGFGTYGLDAWVEAAQRRVGTAYGLEMIKGVLRAVGVEKWEDLVGQTIRLRCTHTEISAIGHIVRDEWLCPKLLWERIEARKSPPR